MKLYAALTNELTTGYYGYAEVTLSYAVKPRQDGEFWEDFLLRVVNSVRRIENSNIAGFIVVDEGNFSKFRIDDGRVVLYESGKIEFLKEKLFDSGFLNKLFDSGREQKK